MGLYDVQTAVDEERAAFMKLAGDDGEIDAYELQDILNHEFKKRQIFCQLVSNKHSLSS